MKDIPNVDPLKPKGRKLTYIDKNIFNINSMSNQSTFAIPFNKNFNEFKALSDEKCDSLIKNSEKTTFINHR
jgi:tRNA U34 5-carboxymethylaminomethyl modifying enzyme MnmG/GidA